jgi:putative tryptophan/tyrosine transport system substrate-binding protein
MNRAFVHRRALVVGTMLMPLSAPIAVIAQPTDRRARIGFLGGTLAPPEPSTLRYQVDPFREGLRELGYVEGQNIEIDYRWADGKPERLPGLLAELLALHPDLLVAAGPRPQTLAKQANLAIPVVAVGGDNPVLAGLVASLAHPGGNITGVATSIGMEMIAKRLQTLKEIVPAARRFAILINPNTVTRGGIDAALPAFEKALNGGIRLHEARGPDEFEGVFARLAHERADAIVILADATFFAHRAKLQALCVKHRLPSAWGGRAYIEPNGLVSFQSDFAAVYKRSAAIVDKILKGTKPGEIPFELPTKFELIVNLRTAKALGITVPQNVLVSADEVLR